MSDPDVVSVDYLLVADAAEAVNGKVYILGGGWDHLNLPEVPGRPATPFAVAVGVSVPWILTNRKLRFSVDVLDADGAEVAKLAGADLEIGRPPGLRAGAPQRFQIAVPAQPEFAAPGRYVIRCSIDGAEIGHTVIEVTARR